MAATQRGWGKKPFSLLSIHLLAMGNMDIMGYLNGFQDVTVAGEGMVRWCEDEGG